MDAAAAEHTRQQEASKAEPNYFFDQGYSNRDKFDELFRTFCTNASAANPSNRLRLEQSQIGQCLTLVEAKPTTSDAALAELCGKMNIPAKEDGKYSIYFNEFCTLWAVTQNAKGAKVLEEYLMFKELDTDNSGKIKANELEAFLNGRLGLGIPDETLQKVIKESDDNNDGMLNFVEFSGFSLV